MHKQPLLSTRRFLHALAAIALVLVGRFAETIHSAEVGHVVCPEHGELLHVAETHEHASASVSEVPVGDRVVPVESPAEHHHCLLATLLWSSGANWSPAQAEFCAPRAVEVHSVASGECARFSLPPLSFAPKHSPPTSVA